MKRTATPASLKLLALFAAVLTLTCCQNAGTLALAPLSVTNDLIVSLHSSDTIHSSNLHRACVQDDSSLLDLKLLASIPGLVNKFTPDGYTPLHLALRANKPYDFLKYLIDAGADPNLPTKDGETCLNVALESLNELDVIQLLVESGADVNAFTCSTTALGEAIRSKASLQILEYLLKSGADIEKFGDSPIACSTFGFAAISWAKAETLNFLLENGADPYPDLLLILDSTRWRDYLSSLPEELLQPERRYPFDRIASTNDSWSFLSEDSLTLIDYAVCRGNIEQYKKLASMGFHTSQELASGHYLIRLPIAENQISLVKELIKEGYDINLTDKSGKAPIHFACESNNIELFKFLIASGADINQKMSNGDTPLHVAIKSQSIKTAVMLLERGANPDVRNSDGESPVELASNMELDQLLPHLFNKRQVYAEID